VLGVVFILNKKVSEYMLTAFILGIVLFSILYYVVNYNSWTGYQLIDLEEYWFLISFNIISVLLIIGYPIISWIRRKAIGEYIFTFQGKVYNWVYIIASIFFISFFFNVIIFFKHPGYIPLSTLINSAMLFIVLMIPLLFEKSGITSKGIKYERNHYLWKDIQSYTWIEERKDLKLQLTVLHRMIKWKITTKIKIKVERSLKVRIDCLLDGKIKQIY